MKKYLLPIIICVLGVVSLGVFEIVGSYVDTNGVLHEPFALLPVGIILCALGLLLGLFVYIQSKRPETEESSSLLKKNGVLIAILLVGFFVGLYIYTSQRITSPLPPTTTSAENKIEDVTDFYKITAAYPIDPLDTNHAMEQFVTYQTQQRKEAWKIGGDAYNQEQQISKDFPDRPKMQYELSISYKKYFSKVYDITSYVFTTYEFTGGANGNITVATFAFNKDGRVMIDSILNFNDYNDIALSKLFATQILADPDPFTTKDMLYDGLGLSYLKADGKTLDTKKCNCDGFFFGSNFQNFVVKDDGLLFIFSKYQIAPGAAGTPEFMLSWTDMKPYLTNQFINVLQ